MAIRIGQNIASLGAQRRLSEASSTLSKAYERLSSGLRINSASDDAAGLAVASTLKADARIYSQGVRNLNDGISALNIADGALDNLSSITTRLQELAEQSANGTLGSKQRQSLDAEAQALAKEYFRIARTTEFNGLNLFDGSIQGLSLQAGYGASGSILSSLGGDLGTGTFGAALSYQTESGASGYSCALSMSDVNGDGMLDLVTAGSDGSTGYATIRLGNGDGTFKKGLSYRTETGGQSNALSMSDLNGDGVLDLVTAGFMNDGTDHGYATIRIGNSDGSFRASLSYQTEGFQSTALSISDVNGDGVLDLVTAGEDLAGKGYATIRLGNGDGTFKAKLSYETEKNPWAISMSDINGDGVLDLVTAGQQGSVGRATIRLGNGDGTFMASRFYTTETGAGSVSRALSMSDVNGDGVLDLVTAGSNGSTGYATIRLGNGDGTFRSSLSYQTESLSSNALSMADLNGDGVLDLVTAGTNPAQNQGYATIRLGNGDGTFKAWLSYQTEGASTTDISMADVNRDGVPDFVTAGYDLSNGYATIRLANTQDGISPILPFSLKTQAEALQALPILKQAQDRLSIQRGQIGAFQSRINSALSTLGSTVLQYQGAASRIADADIAQESSTLVRTQILQQTASAVLGQANQAPALALLLLKG